MPAAVQRKAIAEWPPNEKLIAINSVPSLLGEGPNFPVLVVHRVVPAKLVDSNGPLIKPRSSSRYSPDDAAPVPPLRARADLRPRAVVLVAFFPPIAELLSRRPRAPTCDLPSLSC
jgi:hypothetical protein